MNTVMRRESLHKKFLWPGALVFALIGVYNSLQVNSSSYNDSTGIRFVKRLDEMQGRVVVGRMAASLQKWSPLELNGLEKKKEKVALKQKKARNIIKKKEFVANSDTSSNNAPEPAINEDLSLELTQVFFKKPLDPKSFNGYAKTYDGYIQELVVSLPNGKNIYIDTRERMVGNVFQYEDTVTGEPKSGLIYEVKKGEQYMVTLTDDTAYGGLRLGFKTHENSQLQYQYDQYNNPVEAVDKSSNAFAQKGDSKDDSSYDNYYDHQEETQQDYENPYDNGGYSFNFNAEGDEQAQI